MTDLRAENVSKAFAGVVALSDVSLRMTPGQIHGLIGPNGCGKTTLLNLISGYYATDQGTVAIGDVHLNGKSVDERATMGVARTFQTPRVLGRLSALDNVMLGAWRHRSASFLEYALRLPRCKRAEKMNTERAAELLRGVGLGQAINRRADTLEHGEQRFLEIARALMLRPRFVLMDEPAGGLSHVEIERLGSVIELMSKMEIGILLVEHHTDFVFGVCHHVTALKSGRFLTSGTSDFVRQNDELARVYLGE